jgi:hypothetical protein
MSWLCGCRAIAPTVPAPPLGWGGGVRPGLGERSVGIIGSENNSINWLFDAVPVVGILGTRFRPLGMARALTVTALAQVLVAVIALAAGFSFIGPVTVFFTGMWLISAWLFRDAARA